MSLTLPGFRPHVDSEANNQMFTENLPVKDGESVRMGPGLCPLSGPIMASELSDSELERGLQGRTQGPGLGLLGG